MLELKRSRATHFRVSSAKFEGRMMILSRREESSRFECPPLLVQYKRSLGLNLARGEFPSTESTQRFGLYVDCFYSEPVKPDLILEAALNFPLLLA